MLQWIDLPDGKSKCQRSWFLMVATPVRMATINKSANNNCWRGCGERGTLLPCWWECRLVVATVEVVWEYLQKLKMGLPFDLVILLLDPKTLIWKNISIPTFIVALCTIAKIWKQPKCPSVDEWTKQLWDIYTMEYYSDVKKKKILPFVTVWMDLENTMLSEISQSEKDKYHMISLLCGL